MCGRFTLTAPDEDVAAYFEVVRPFPTLAPRYNVAPSQVIAVVGLKSDGRRGLALLKWGLVAYWEQMAKPKFKPMNVRAESVRWKFGYQLRERRCLIPGDGFYEWSSREGKMVPHRFTAGGIFAFAGLWDVWQGDGQKLLTCALVTTTANAVVKPYHARMKVIVPSESYSAWLDPDAPEKRLLELLVP